jgi:hypothetical protein
MAKWVDGLYFIKEKYIGQGKLDEALVGLTNERSRTSFGDADSSRLNLCHKNLQVYYAELELLRNSLKGSTGFLGLFGGVPDQKKAQEHIGNAIRALELFGINCKSIVQTGKV